MVDSRQKGARAELQARDVLRKYTSLKWERVPGSGSLDEKHGLKGDLYVPNEKNIYCVEVKHYKDDQLTSKILTTKSPKFIEWWEQTVRESKQIDKLPMLLFKYDRSKWFIASDTLPFESALEKAIVIPYQGTYISIALLEEVLALKNIGWVV